MNELTWNLNGGIKGGPTFSAKKSNFEVDAYDKIIVDIDSGESNKRVDIQPNEDRLYFLLIDLLVPEDEGDTTQDDNATPVTPPASLPTLTYKVNGEGNSITLKDQHILIGNCAWQLLNAVPKWLTFTSTYEKTVEVTILVARQATERSEDEDCTSE